ncbi:MAG TPA: hypothetical protein VFQ63_01855 [Patescibacteria group bacterium]|nr:hypothetical protein [Patescibacteria group bacterium]
MHPERYHLVTFFILFTIIGIVAISEKSLRLFSTEKNILPVIHPTVIPSVTQEVPTAATTPIVHFFMTTISQNPPLTPQPDLSGEWVYPSSLVISKSNTTITMTSSDDPSIITAWYQEKISHLFRTATTIAKTNANGNVFNQISVSSDNNSVRITIQKTNDEKSTRIEVSF